MCRGMGRGKWGRFHHPSFTSVTSVRSATLIMAGLLLVLSACAAQKNAVTPVAKSTVSPDAKGAVSSGAKSAVTPVPTESIQPAQAGTTMVATLKPENPNTTGTGTAHVQLDPQKQEICYTIHVSGIELPSTATHIHQGAAGVNGPVVVPFTAPNAKGVSTGCVKASPNLIAAIEQHPADYYVNVHNAHYPDGAIRGQLAACKPHSAC